MSLSQLKYLYEKKKKKTESKSRKMKSFIFPENLYYLETFIQLIIFTVFNEK